MKQIAILRVNRNLPVAQTNITQLDAPGDWTLTAFRVESDKVSIGAPSVFDVNLNATTLFTDQTERPRILAGASEVELDSLDIATEKGDKISVDLDSVPASGIGENLQLTFTFDDHSGTLLGWRGEWDAETAYALDHTVSFEGSSFIAVAPSTGIEPGTDPEVWQMLAQKGDPGSTGATGADGATGQGYAWRGAWDSATAYVAYDTVAHEGSSFVAIAASTNVEPGTDPAKWNLLAEKGADGAVGGGGAPTDAKYIVAEASAGLSEGIVIPSFAGHPDQLPASPHSKDDEFDAGSLDVKWSWANQGSSSVAFDGPASWLKFTPDAGAYPWRVITQAVPAGNWSARCRCSLGGSFTADSFVGLIILPASDGEVEANCIGKGSDAGFPTWKEIWLRSERWTNYSTFNVEREYHELGANHVYLRTDWDGTNLTYYFSTDGIAYVQRFAAFAPAFTPGRFGIGARGASVPHYFDWFRVV
ncbi:MAG: hypothetical protein WCF57_20350 [Pyrinomonadaceae bacterium]